MHSTLRCSLEDNYIGGYYDDDGEFHADLTGVEKLAEALKINGSLRELKYVCQCSPCACPTTCACACQQPLTHPFTLVRSLRYNSLGTESWSAIFAALRDNKDNKIESWDFFDQGINAEIAKVLAEYVSVSTAITSLK